MALSEALETLIKTLPAEVQAQQRAILEKHPALGEGWLRQNDYDRFLNENKGKLSKYDETMDWYKRTKPVHDQTVADLKEAQEKAARLEAASAAAGGGNVDAEKVAKAVMENLGKTMPTKTELATLIAEETKKQADSARDNFFKSDVPQALGFMTAMNDVQWKYRDEFGKSMDRVEFAKFMTENKLSDPIEAYERYTEKDRRAREVKAEVDKQLEEEKKKLRSEFVPGSTGSQGTGHLQIRVSEKKAGDPLFGQDIELGDNAAAMSAAAELRAEGKL
jgi:hypothetical protein